MWLPLLVLVGIAMARPAHAVSWQRPLSEAVHRIWSTEKGLPGVSVTALAQTPDGYIWIGTQAGLVRFDGHTFLKFDRSTVPAFTNGSWISALAVDGEGSLWIGTVGSGVLHHRRGEFTAFTSRDGLASNQVRALAIGSSGTIWVGTTTGVDALKDGRIVDFPARPKLVGHEAATLLAEDDGSLWVGLVDVGLCWISGSDFRLFDRASGLSALGAEKIVRDHEGTFWVASGTGVYRREGDRFVLLEGTGVGDEGALTLYVDRNDALWISGTGGGLRVAHHGVVQSQSEPVASLARERIAVIFEDREGTLWLGTESNGLHALRDGTFQVIRLPENAMAIFCVREARDGSLWLGTLYSGVIHLHDGQVTSYAEKEGVASGGIYAIHEDELGGIWIGTSRSLVKRVGSRFVEASEIAKLGGGHVVFALAGRHDSLWAAVQGVGLVHLQGDRSQVFTQNDGLPSADTWSLYEARDGALWIGTRAGLSRRDGDRFIDVRPGDGSQSPAIGSFYEDDRGALWVGGLGGIGQYKDGTLRMFPPVPGVPSDALLVSGDGRRNLWVGVGTGAGIYRVPMEDLERSAAPSATIRVRAFDEFDGLQSREANGGVGLIRLRDGRMAFATMKGLALVNPGREVRNSIEPAVVIQRLEVDGSELRIDNRVTLQAGTRYVRIDYAALTFASPERVRYRYKLEGYDRAWIDAGSDRSVRYTNLSPGTYQFAVMAENGDGIWSREGARILLTQRAFFYQTTWFYVLAAGSALVSALGVYRYRIGQVRAVATMLERRINERTAELRYALGELREKDDRLHADLVQARAFQQALLPVLPRAESVTFAALYEPAEQVGGDIYDIAEIGPRLYRVFLADTTGHGVQASLKTIMLKNEYDRLKHAVSSPGALLTKLNTALFSSSERSVRCSACCIDVDASTPGKLKIRYANAAHPELLRLGKERGSLYTPGMYVGFTPDVVYGDLEAELGPGETLVVYSDGATERQDSSGHDFGADRLAQSLEDVLVRGGDTSAALKAAYQAILQFSAVGGGTSAPADDVTMILIHATEEGQGHAVLDSAS